MVRKSNEGVWGDAFEFDGANPKDHLSHWEEETAEAFLEEAHEALSRLFTKTNKRGKAQRVPRKGEAWQ